MRRKRSLYLAMSGICQHGAGTVSTGEYFCFSQSTFAQPALAEIKIQERLRRAEGLRGRNNQHRRGIVEVTKGSQRAQRCGPHRVFLHPATGTSRDGSWRCAPLSATLGNSRDGPKCARFGIGTGHVSNEAWWRRRGWGVCVLRCGFRWVSPGVRAQGPVARSKIGPPTRSGLARSPLTGIGHGCSSG